MVLSVVNASGSAATRKAAFGTAASSKHFQAGRSGEERSGGRKTTELQSRVVVLTGADDVSALVAQGPTPIARKITQIILISPGACCPPQTPVSNTRATQMPRRFRFTSSNDDGGGPVSAA